MRSASAFQICQSTVWSPVAGAEPSWLVFRYWNPASFKSKHCECPCPAAQTQVEHLPFLLQGAHDWTSVWMRELNRMERAWPMVQSASDLRVVVGHHDLHSVAFKSFAIHFWPTFRERVRRDEMPYECLRLTSDMNIIHVQRLKGTKWMKARRRKWVRDRHTQESVEGNQLPLVSPLLLRGSGMEALSGNGGFGSRGWVAGKDVRPGGNEARWGRHLGHKFCRCLRNGTWRNTILLNLAPRRLKKNLRQCPGTLHVAVLQNHLDKL